MRYRLGRRVPMQGSGPDRGGSSPRPATAGRSPPSGPFWLSARAGLLRLEERRSTHGEEPFAQRGTGFLVGGGPGYPPHVPGGLAVGQAVPAPLYPPVV